MKLEEDSYKNFKHNNLDVNFNYYIDNILKLPKYSFQKKILNSQYSGFFHKLLKFIIKSDFFISGKPSFGMLDFMITTRCTLRCEQCCSLMTFYNNETHCNETFETFKIKLDNLLNSINKIYRFQLIGGEPLLVKDLHKMLEYAAEKKQLKSVQIVTNGTLMPSSEVMDILKRYKHKCMVAISDYSSNEELKNLKPQEVYQSLKNAGISAEIVNYEWFSRGDIKKENRSIEELKKEFSSCWQHTCTSYCDGELHICSRSIAIKRNLDNNIRDYVKITPKNCSDEAIKLFSRDYIDACDYCHTRNDILIERGKQIKNSIEV